MTIRFNPEGKALLTYGECLTPAMEITDPQEAEQYLQDYAAYIQGHLDEEPRGDDKTAMEIAKINIGYFAGYYSQDVAERVFRLFQTSHPYFGTTIPTPEEAFNAGKQAVQA